MEPVINMDDIIRQTSPICYPRDFPKRSELLTSSPITTFLASSSSIINIEHFDRDHLVLWEIGNIGGYVELLCS
jgi:hypothetical protein